MGLFDGHTGEKIFSSGFWKRIIFIFPALLVFFLSAGCSSDDGSAPPAPLTKEIVITDLLLPQWEGNQVTEWKSMVIDWTATAAPPLILQKGLKEWWDLGGIQRISKAQLRKKCLLPYINGLWLDTEALLRTPKMIGQAAVDKLILPPEGGMKGWPVYYPPMHGFVVEIIALNNQGSGIELDVKPLPAEKPAAGSVEGNKLYNNLGLLYLPNAYVVPGGTFNEMYGWDSFFIIIGLLDSAAYLYENMGEGPVLWDAETNDFRAATLDDVKHLFQIAKGMADNHIYEISFYGGYILNANRSYYLTRSQSPLFTREILAIYAFQKAYGQKIGLEYVETLSPYFEAVTPGFQAPTDFDQWMEREAVPAASVYYNYWTDPDRVYTGWNPHTSATAGTNSRVVTLEEKGSAASPGEAKTFEAYCFHTDGVGPAPEVVRSTQPQNRGLYDDAALFFEKFPGENPMDPVTRTGMFRDQSSPYYAHLTEKFYAADRAIRASGYDLSGRYGTQGQYALNYAPVSLNTLLYQMGLDLMEMLQAYGCYGMTSDEIAALIHVIDSRTVQGKYVINHLMWTDSGPHGYFSDARIQEEGTSTEHPYAYGTLFYPLWADGLIEETEQAINLLQTASASEPLTQDQVFSLKSAGETELIWIHDNPGEICTLSEPDMTFHCTEAIHQSFISPQTTKVHPENFGIPTSLVLTGNQWDHPFSWAPVQFFAARGLKNWATKINTNALLSQVLTGWTDAADAFFAKTGTLIEKYVSTDPIQDPRASRGYQEAQIGFGWTNGVYLEALLMLQAP